MAKESIEIIEQLNRQSNGTVKYGFTKFSDMTQDVFIRIMTMDPRVFEENDFESTGSYPCLVTSKRSDNSGTPSRLAGEKQPLMFDWRAKGVVGPVLDQGHVCLSCWAYSVVGVMESMLLISNQTDHYSRLSIQEVTNIKEEFNAMFDDEETEKCGRHVVPADKYEKLRMDHENLIYELEGYKNEAHLAKDEAERKFEKFKAHWIAQQALQNRGQPQVFPPLPPPPLPNMAAVPPMTSSKPQPPPPTPDDDKIQTSGPAVPPSEAKLISILTAFLMVHPLGASLDYLVSYVRSMVPNVTQATVQQTLQKYSDVFARQTSGIGANIEHRWGFKTFDIIKNEIH